MSASLTIALGVELPPEIVERARKVSPGVKLWTAAELERDPSGYREAEVALITGWLEQEHLREARKLRWVQTVGAGVERLLSPEVVARSELVITNASGVHAQPIAEHVWGFLLMFTRNLHLAAARQHEGVWQSQTYRETLRSLRGKTLGVLGLGAIGERIASIAPAFGVRVIGLKRTRAPVDHVAEVYGPDDLEAFLAQSELLVNVLPLTAKTRGWIGRRELAALPRGAFFVNVGRGATVQTDALVEALRSGHLAGAGLDVTEPEPLPAEHPLWKLPNVIITPHYSGAQPGYFQQLGELFVSNLQRYVRGEPLVNVVDKQGGY
ncbi:D-2-hydroxyacid dehydrogenase [Sorangium sp. So ce1078]|uniref:D-2-hydroxyacid dehydrogenase n=1 Tax=Sorangium sp. So ce1078 TaxID=3133329 RepID=UPI003F5E4C7E